MLVELRFEVDETSGVSVEVELNPFFSVTLFGEEIEWDLSLSDVEILEKRKVRKRVIAIVSVENLDVDLVNERTSFDDHVLSVPDWVFSAVFANN